MLYIIYTIVNGDCYPLWECADFVQRVLFESERQQWLLVVALATAPCEDFIQKPQGWELPKYRFTASVSNTQYTRIIGKDRFIMIYRR